MKCFDKYADESVMSADLQCKWQRWDVMANGTLVLYVPHGNRTDMSGTIKVAKLLMPSVCLIVVSCGYNWEVAYFLREEGEWDCIDFKNSRIKTEADGGLE